jgi:hypothetical protein
MPSVLRGHSFGPERIGKASCDAVAIIRRDTGYLRENPISDQGPAKEPWPLSELWADQVGRNVLLTTVHGFDTDRSTFFEALDLTCQSYGEYFIMRKR